MIIADIKNSLFTQLANAYRVIEVYGSHDSIDIFPDTTEGCLRAIQLAKLLCRSRHERCRLYDEGRLDDPDTLVAVQRFQCDVEVLGLFSPQDRPDFQRFGHLPGADGPASILTTLSTLGRWTCLELPEDPTISREVQETMSKLQSIVQSLEAAVRAAASQASVPALAGFEHGCSEFDELFRRLYDVGQQRTPSLGPDDFAQALLTLPEFDSESAWQVAVELDAAQRQVCEAVTDSQHTLASELQEQQRGHAEADLRVFIYEVLLSGVCDQSQS